MTAPTLTVAAEDWPIAGIFRIARGSRTQARVLTVTLTDGNFCGRGECVPYARYGESIESVRAAIEGLSPLVQAHGQDLVALQDALQMALPAGAARNAVDCAVWDLRAKLSDTPVWRLAGLPSPPQTQVTAYTLSVDTPAAMAAIAAANAHRPLLKLKLTGAGDLERVVAIRTAAPAAQLIVDANEAWTPGDLARFTPLLADLGVALIEQPLPAGQDDDLRTYDGPVPLCADESCHDTASLAHCLGKYRCVNIKLDKTGGLTEALKLLRAARAAKLDVMIGCMVGTSLAMAPALLLAQDAQWVDLDGPLLLAEDRQPGLRYRESVVEPPDAALWG
jgi:L-Ala-D/L-Glu epimerase